MDGKTFDFGKVKDRVFMLHINGSFWVKYSGGTLTISKDDKGYIRKTDLDLLSDRNGFMADGLTINLGGVSNLEDGGDPFGDPTVDEITGKGQWFNIVTMDVYCPQL